MGGRTLQNPLRKLLLPSSPQGRACPGLWAAEQEAEFPKAWPTTSPVEKILQRRCDPLEPQVAHEGNVLRGPLPALPSSKVDIFSLAVFLINIFVTIFICFPPPNQKLQ